MPNKDRLTGRLENVRIILGGEDLRAPCLNGKIYDDAGGRFHDGMAVTTSTLMEDMGGGYFRTRNSLYLVGSWWQGDGFIAKSPQPDPDGSSD